MNYRNNYILYGYTVVEYTGASATVEPLQFIFADYMTI